MAVGIPPSLEGIRLSSAPSPPSPSGDGGLAVMGGAPVPTPFIAPPPGVVPGNASYGLHGAVPPPGLGPNYTPGLYATGAYATPVSHPLALENERRYKAYSASQQLWADQGAADVEFVYGAHWTAEQAQALEDRAQMPLTIPVLYQLVSQAVAMLTANRPAFQAAAREDSDAPLAHVASAILSWIWEQSGGQTLLKRAVTDYYVCGRGALYAYVDPYADLGKGDVVVCALHPFEVFPDPSSTHPLWDDAADIIIRRVMTGEAIRQAWPYADLTRAVEVADEFPYGPTGQHYGLDQQLWPVQIDRDAGLGRKRYEVIERLEKVRLPHWRLTNPQTGVEEVLSEPEAEARFVQPAFAVGEGSSRSSDPATGQARRYAVYDPRAVAELQALYDAVGPVHHLRPVAPVGAGMEAVPMPPQPVPGDEAEVAEAGGVPGRDFVPGSTVRLARSNVGELVAAGLVPAARFLKPCVRVTASFGGALLYEPFVLPTEHYPAVPLSNNHARTPYTVSDVRLVRDLQRAVNKAQSLILAHAANSTNMKVFYPRGAIRDVEAMKAEWAKAGTGWIEYDPQFSEATGTATGGIVIASPPPLPAALYENMDRFIGLMERTLGIFSLMQGDASNAPATYKGTIQIDEYGLRRIKSKMDDVYAALSRLGQVAFDLAQAVYTPERILRIVNPARTAAGEVGQAMTPDDFTAVAHRIEDVTVARYDMHVVAGSTLPSNRWALLETYMQMFERGLVDQEAVLKRAEIPDAAKILERTGIAMQLQQALGQAQATIEQLQGDLQTRERELFHANQRAEIAAFRSGLTSAEGDMKKSAQLFDGALRQQLTNHQVQLAAIRQIHQARLAAAAQQAKPQAA